MKAQHKPHLLRAGFSLVEMVGVIVVIGVIAAFAIPNIGTIDQSDKDARNQHNAQSIVSTYHSGVAAGVVWNGSIRDVKVDAVIAGQAPEGGTFAGKVFKVHHLSNKDEACKYIGIDSNGDLFYDKTGGQPAALE